VSKVTPLRSAKRKKQEVESADETTDDEHRSTCTVAGPSTTSSTAPASSNRDESEERQTNDTPVAPSTPAATVDTARPSQTNPKIRVPTIGGLQRELHDLKQLVVRLSENQELLLNENMMLRGSLEVLMGLKDKMLTSIPVLEAEMRGLRSGMEWEKMKQQMTSLRSEVKNTKD
jgi:hypothetical protein